MWLRPTPAYAPKSDAALYGMRLSTYHAIQERRGDLLTAVHDGLCSYCNTDRISDEDSDDFPNWGRLTGQYYIGDISYTPHVEPVWYEIAVNARFLERQFHDNQSDFDYLNLEVYVKCVPEDWTFEVLDYNSSVI